MKTQLPEIIKSPAYARVFLAHLYGNGEEFHPEDDAHDIEWNLPEEEIPTKEECDQLNRLTKQMYTFEDFDPCEFLWFLREREVRPMNFDEFRKTRKDLNLEQYQKLSDETYSVEDFGFFAQYTDNCFIAVNDEPAFFVNAGKWMDYFYVLEEAEAILYSEWIYQGIYIDGKGHMNDIIETLEEFTSTRMTLTEGTYQTTFYPHGGSLDKMERMSVAFFLYAGYYCVLVGEDGQFSVKVSEDEYSTHHSLSAAESALFGVYSEHVKKGIVKL